MHAYEIRPRRDHHGVDLISDALPFGVLWYTEPNDAVDFGLAIALGLPYHNRSNGAAHGRLDRYPALAALNRKVS
jgi:hypothetical protein